MECSEFEVILQDRLDRRLPLPLGDEAGAHLRQCFACEQDYQFFQQLSRLTQNPAPDTRLGSVSRSETPGDRNLEQVIGRCLAALGSEFDTEDSIQGLLDEAGREHWPADPLELEAHAPNSNDGIPLAQWVSLPDENGPSVRRFSGSEATASRSARPAGLAEHGLETWTGSRVSRSNPKRSADRLAALAAVVSATLLLVAVGWMAWRLTPANPQLSRLSTEPSSAATEAAGSATGTQEAVATPLASANLREIAKNWDDSVVAFDRGWQQMAVGRVRAHQIPGMQPAVYPITGAVEAFRKNWIRRNPDGLAAGLQW